MTKYSPFNSVHPFQQDLFSNGDDIGITSNEVVLHFSNFDKMGTREDAEIMELDDIVAVDVLSSGLEAVPGCVNHVVYPPQVTDEGEALFCRFGVCTTSDTATACITPIASKLLEWRDRRRGPKFTGDSGSVFDLTPHVLGPSEGFSQSGFTVEAALGFDQDQDITWQVSSLG